VFKSWVDRFSVFEGNIHIAGWAFADDRALQAIEFVADGDRSQPVPHINCESPDVAKHFGPAAARARFHGRFQLRDGVESPGEAAALRFCFDDGSVEVLQRIGHTELTLEPGHALYRKFLERLQKMRPGRFLELGSRARSGHIRREHVPAGWEYIGADVLAGPNVDLVVDAHRLSRAIRRRSIDAMMSLSVFEHLAMPWKVAIELNRVMAKGAIGLIQTHQSYPLHDQPWDFWRISADAWPALFNKATGFRILKAGMAEPSYLVAARWHPIVDHRTAVGYAVSSVMFEKVAETRLDWDVDPEILVSTPYPH
jgi:hypothetical protein